MGGDAEVGLEPQPPVQVADVNRAILTAARWVKYIFSFDIQCIASWYASKFFNSVNDPSE